MLAILLLLVFSINGGLYTGGILYSAYKAAKVEKKLSYVKKIYCTSYWLL